MDRTPIKIRGKKKLPARKTGAGQSTQSTQSTLTTLTSDPKGKLSISDISESFGPPTKLARQTESKLQLKVFAKCSSRLELLPTELLEFVFFYCLNISLPRASPAIGQKLASTHVKYRLVLQAFDVSKHPISSRENGAGQLTEAEQADTQSAILRQRWMTLPFLRQLIPDFIVKTIVRELGARKLQWMGQGPAVSRESEHVIRKYLEDNALHFSHTIPKGLPAYLELSWPSEKPLFHQTRLGIELRDGVITLLEVVPRNGSPNLALETHTWRILRCVKGCQIPEKLLHGPWTDEKCDFLELAIRGNAQVDWVTSTSGEVAEQGFMQAIHAHNHRAIRALHARTGSVPQHPNPEHYPLSFKQIHNPDNQRRLDPRPIYRDAICRGVGIVPQQKHLRTAGTYF
ncbi:hypothetical protein N7G274_004382 [Stereocaulon virgatum]|uniref:F-box domain-containing protein n=1 Tax=Stereocaulon virgatum TaxID=373712 RepID=A0ABR4AGV0_9LECA